MQRIRHAVTLLMALATILLVAAVRHADERGDLFERVAETLSRRYYDESYRNDLLPGLIDRYRDRALNASDLDGERQVIDAMLAEIPASHLALISAGELDRMFKALSNQEHLTFGFETIEIDGSLYAHAVLDGGPAMEAGVATGDRIVSIDGSPPKESALLDWRSDDAHLSDPPIRALRAEADHILKLSVARDEGLLKLSIPARRFSAFDASKNSVRVIDDGDQRIGYVHLWFIYISGCDTLIREALQGPLSDCDALVLDLRGRGGSAVMVPRVINIIKQCQLPVVALIDDLTRSAKEAIAFDLRDENLATLVGTETPGALLPAAFERVGGSAVLMFPAFKLPKYSDAVEGIGVEPHIVVAPNRTRPSDGDAILKAGVREASRQAKLQI